MNLARINNATRSFGPPPGVSDNDCSHLPIRDMSYGSFKGMQSAWIPTEEELKLLNNGGCVILTVFSRVHPMVSLHAAGSDEISRVQETAQERKNISGVYPDRESAIDAMGKD
jgi:hypothetical protein